MHIKRIDVGEKPKLAILTNRNKYYCMIEPLDSDNPGSDQ